MKIEQKNRQINPTENRKRKIVQINKSDKENRIKNRTKKSDKKLDKKSEKKIIVQQASTTVMVLAQVIECLLPLLPCRPKPHSNLTPTSTLRETWDQGKETKWRLKIIWCSRVVISPFGLNSNDMASTVNCMAAYWSSSNSITCSKMCFFSNEKKAHKGVRSLQLVTQTLKVGFSWFDEIKQRRLFPLIKVTSTRKSQLCISCL